MNQNTDIFRKSVIHFMNEHWMEDITLEDMAEVSGYKERYFNKKFKECFGMPFPSYMKKLKLHKAAWEIDDKKTLTNIGKMTGFVTAQSFSKAFRNEFGLSPKQFLQSKEEIPPLPVHYDIDGYPVNIEFVEMGRIILHGYGVTPIGGNDCNLRAERAYFFRHPDENIDTSENAGDMIGLWWHDEQCEVKYVMGPVIDQDIDAPKGRMKIELQEDYYLCISTSRKINRNPADIVQMMGRFLEEEWGVINRVNFAGLGYQFERYTKDSISLYIPVQKRSDEVMRNIEETGADAWINYIDEHILDNPTVKSLAGHFHYSERHFRDSFEMYFDITVGEYIKRRKLYLAANEVRHGIRNVEEIANRYGFLSPHVFRKEFREIFDSYPEDYEGEEYKAENLLEYYSAHKDLLKMRFLELQTTWMYGKDATSKDYRDVSLHNLIEYIVYWLKNDDSDIRKTEFSSDKTGWINKMVCWQRVPESGKHICIVGPEVTKECETPENLMKVEIKGGNYACFESPNESDEAHLVETYRMLYRCAFTGWLQENRARMDFKRITFVRYVKGKLYFFIPVNE